MEALNTLLLERQVAYSIRGDRLLLAASNQRFTLPFEEVARLVNVQRGRWEALSLWDDHVVATGVSQRDVVRATIFATWH